MVSYYNPVPMFGRNASVGHNHSNVPTTSNPYFAPNYTTYPSPHPHHVHPSIHPQFTNSANNNGASPLTPSNTLSDFQSVNSNHQYSNPNHQIPHVNSPESTITPSSASVTPWTHSGDAHLYNTGCHHRNYEDWPSNHYHNPHPHHSSFHHPNFYCQFSPPNTNLSINLPTDQSPSTNPPPFKLDPSSTPINILSQENSPLEIRTEQTGRGTGTIQVHGSATPSIPTPHSIHSPDSGMAISDGVSSSGSPAIRIPNLGQLSLASRNNAQHATSPEMSLNDISMSMRPDSCANTNLNHQLLHIHSRPGQARSPYEWMKKPAYNLSTHSSNGKTRTKDKYRVVYSDTQRLELEKEFHYSRYITIRRKAELASILGLSERQVKIWFQNRRAKERKIVRKREEIIHREKIATLVNSQNVSASMELNHVTTSVCSHNNSSSLILANLL